ncbi:hypothetical protein [Candidatus Desulfovibrio trichonymphae]|uniref:hypothetical protein n=1 Tax=Candidatus Desulfovibrio trichonymphae TaxID=1725232 RepID=UPI000BBA933B|nr:hypothetical protein [Candidatus Desulfovibrio trichonymphae]GHU91663.1 hypothetical protein AGMMS49925_07310 [Deltaproteobacteria bacterium]GHU97698.1 hypothetical protein AGMMS50248_02810 [Deltaproteobacteria bacterium]
MPIADTLRQTRSVAAFSLTTPESFAVHSAKQLSLLFDLAQIMNSSIAVQDALDQALALMGRHMHTMRGNTRQAKSALSRRMA